MFNWNYLPFLTKETLEKSHLDKENRRLTFSPFCCSESRPAIIQEQTSIPSTTATGLSGFAVSASFTLFSFPLFPLPFPLLFALRFVTCSAVNALQPLSFSASRFDLPSQCFSSSFLHVSAGASVIGDPVRERPWEANW